MKVIELLNKIANGEEVPKKIRINHWCYEFEWIEHIKNYYDKRSEVDLTNVLSLDGEELNYGIQIINDKQKFDSSNKIEELENRIDTSFENANYSERMRLTEIVNKLNEVIDVINNMEE